MYINATVTSDTGKIAVIAYVRVEGSPPRVQEVRAPIALKQWEVESWIEDLEIRAVVQHQPWGLKR